MTKEELIKKLDGATVEIEFGVIDQLFYGTTITEICSDGTVRRIDPYSLEGQKIIKEGNKDEKRTD